MKNQIYFLGINSYKGYTENPDHLHFKIFDLTTRKFLPLITVPFEKEGFLSLGFSLSANGAFALVKADGFDYSLYKTTDWSQVTWDPSILHQDISLFHMEFSPTGEYLCILMDDNREHKKKGQYSLNENYNSRKLKIMYLAKNKIVFTRNDVQTIAFRPDGKALLLNPSQAGNRDDRRLTGIGFPSGEELFQFEAAGYMPGENVFSKDGRFVYFENAGNIKIFDTQINRTVKQFSGKIIPSSTPVFSAIDNTLFIPSRADGIKIIQPGNIISPGFLPFKSSEISLSNDGKFIAFQRLENKGFVNNIRYYEVMEFSKDTKPVIIDKIIDTTSSIQRHFKFSANEKMISEMQRYVADKVFALTDGKQRPTFRIENITNDWRLWGRAENEARLFSAEPLADRILDSTDLQLLSDKYENAERFLRRRDTLSALRLLDMGMIDRTMQALKNDKALPKETVKQLSDTVFDLAYLGAEITQARNDQSGLSGRLYQLLKYWHFDKIRNASNRALVDAYNKMLVQKFSDNDDALRQRSALEKSLFYNYIANYSSRQKSFDEKIAERAYQASLSECQALLRDPEAAGLIRDSSSTATRIRYYSPEMDWKTDILDLNQFAGIILMNTFKFFYEKGDSTAALERAVQATDYYIEWLEKRGTIEENLLWDILYGFERAQEISGAPAAITLVRALIYQRLVRAAPETDYADKLSRSTTCVELYEAVVKMDNTPENRNRLCQQLGGLAWHQVLNSQFDDAIESAKKALAMDVPQERKEWINTNLALGYLFAGKYSAAEKIYRAMKDKPYAGDTYKKAFLTDLDDVEKAGVRHKDVAKIRELLNK